MYALLCAFDQEKCLMCFSEGCENKTSCCKINAVLLLANTRMVGSKNLFVGKPCHCVNAVNAVS